MSRLRNDQPGRISIYRLQRRPSFAFESSVSSTPMTSGEWWPCGRTHSFHCTQHVQSRGSMLKENYFKEF